MDSNDTSILSWCSLNIKNNFSVLVIAPPTLCEKLKNGLLNMHKYSNKTFKLIIHTSSDIKSTYIVTPPLSVNFIVYVIDITHRHCLKEVEQNMKLIDNKFIIFEYICFVNGVITNIQKQIITENVINEFKKKYNILMLQGNLMDTEKCLMVSQQILNLISLKYNSFGPILFGKNI